MEEIQNKIVKSIAEYLGVTVDEISPVTDLRADLNLEPMEIVELVQKLADIYKVEIAEEDIQNFQTIGDILDFVLDNLQ